MSKPRYTIKTEGSRTVVHYEGKLTEDRARGTSTGRYVDGPTRPPRRSEDGPDDSEKKER
jgi:hypothetical protein